MIGKGTNPIPPPPKKIAGAPQRWIWEVSKRLIKRHEVIICSPNDRTAFHTKDEIPLLYVKKMKIRMPRAPAVFAYTRKIVNYYLKAVAYVRELNPDIVHFHATAPHPLFLSKTFAKNVHPIISVHQCVGFRTLSFPSKSIEDHLISYSFGKADAILPVSKYVGKFLKTRFRKIRQKNFHVTYCGVDPSLFRFDEKSSKETRDKYKLSGDPVILFVGRIVPEKGVHLLLEAYRTVKKKVPNAKLLLVGPIQTYRHINYASNIIKACKNGIRFLGSVSHRELVSIFCAADLFVNPVLIPEAFGMVNVEAMACEKPVVATQIGAIPEVVENGKTGMLVPPGKTAALAEAILRIIKDQSLAEEMGNAGRVKVLRHFTWEKVTERTLEAYKKKTALFT